MVMRLYEFHGPRDHRPLKVAINAINFIYLDEFLFLIYILNPKHFIFLGCLYVSVFWFYACDESV